MEGNEKGPFSVNGCDSGWRMVECNDLKPCATFDSCNDCTQRARCGWCPSTLDQAEQVRCVAMRLQDVVGKPTEWMPPQIDRWCPGATYQHKYKDQCQLNQPTQPEAIRAGHRRTNVLRADQYSSELILLGDTVRAQLKTLLRNVNVAKQTLQNEVAEIQQMDSKLNSALNTYYISSNKTNVLSTATLNKKNIYEQTNTSYYEMLKTVVTPGNATSDDVLVQVQRQQLDNVTRDRSSARDTYELSNNLLILSKNETTTYKCIANIYTILSQAIQKRSDMLLQEETDDARVAEVVNLHLKSNSTTSEDSNTIATAQSNYEDEYEKVQILETTSSVQNVELESYRAMEEQNVKVQEATVLHKEAVRQTELNALVKLHAKWVTLNQTALEQLHKQSIQVETSSLESKNLKKTKAVLNNIDLKLAALFQNTNTAETIQQKNKMQAALTEDRVLATTNIDSAQKKIRTSYCKT
jgi:hypothetical protein